MKVLLVNKFHYLKGGSEKYYFELGKLLEENGHEVAYFSMKNEKNIHLNNKEYFVDEIDLNSNNKLKALDVIYSKENKKLMEKALDDFKPDIVHINMHSSISLLYACLIDKTKKIIVHGHNNSFQKDVLFIKSIIAQGIKIAPAPSIGSASVNPIKSAISIGYSTSIPSK